MDTIELYSDLQNFDNNIEQIQQENAKLVVLRDNLENDLKNLINKVTEMKQSQDKLSVNISELYRTTKSELSRKDRTIEELKQKIKRIEDKSKETTSHKREDEKRSKRYHTNDSNNSSNSKRIRLDNETNDDKKSEETAMKRKRSRSPVDDRRSEESTIRRRRSRSPDQYKSRYKDERHYREDSYRSRRHVDDKRTFVRESNQYKHKTNHEHKNVKSTSNHDHISKLESKKIEAIKTDDQTTSKIDEKNSENNTENKPSKLIILQNKVIQKGNENSVCNGTNNNDDQNVKKNVSFPPDTNTLNCNNKNERKNSIDNNINDDKSPVKRGRRRGRRKSEINREINTNNIIKDDDLTTTPEDEVRVLRSMMRRSRSDNDFENRTETEHNKEIEDNSKELTCSTQSNNLGKPNQLEEQLSVSKKSENSSEIKESSKLKQIPPEDPNKYRIPKKQITNSESDKKSIKSETFITKNCTEKPKDIQTNRRNDEGEINSSRFSDVKTADKNLVSKVLSTTPAPSSDFTKKLPTKSSFNTSSTNFHQIVNTNNKLLENSCPVTPSTRPLSPRSDGELTPSPIKNSDSHQPQFVITKNPLNEDSFPVLHIPENETDCDRNKTTDTVLDFTVNENKLNVLRNDLSMSDISDTEQLFNEKCVNKDSVDSTNVVLNNVHNSNISSNVSHNSTSASNNSTSVINNSVTGVSNNSINNRRRPRCIMRLKNS